MQKDFGSEQKEMWVKTKYVYNPESNETSHAIQHAHYKTKSFILHARTRSHKISVDHILARSDVMQVCLLLQI
jgi:hypothetical protein